MPDPARGMTRSFSLYLDLLRFLSAIAVLVSHSFGRTYGSDVIPGSLGHNAVIVFFLLSGYVIAHVADHKENTPRAFWISRLARVYSVALPAILLTPIVDQIGLHFNPAFYAGGMTTHDYPLVRIAASLAFANELWFVSIMPFSNSPYWSLCYEMSYYLLFAIYTFASGARRWAWLGLAALVIGPKILLLGPIWLAGVVLYRHRRWYHISETAGWILWSTSLLAAAAFQYWDLGEDIAGWLAAQIGTEPFKLLHFSKRFLGDYLLTAVIAAHFVGFRRIAARFSGLLELFARPIRAASGLTFSLYLFHLPVVLLATLLLQGMQPGVAYWLLTMAFTLAIVLPLGIATERQKDVLKRWLERHMPAWGPLRHGAAAAHQTQQSMANS
jgi:peptidoglycan/LPS O-acetylase OafA/YrhL